MVDLARVRALDPVALRNYLGDGNFGGLYQRPDEEMLALWQVAVEETRGLLDRLVGRRVLSAPTRMRILVWGAGAIGGTMGAYLARAGHDVTMVDNGRRACGGDRSGRHPHHRPGREVHAARARASRRRRSPATWDTIMLATKAHHTEAATRALLPHLSANGLRDLGAERAQRAHHRA